MNYLKCIAQLPSAWGVFGSLSITDLQLDSIWSENTLSVAQILSNLLVFLWPRMWSIIVYVPRMLKKNVFCFCYMKYSKNVF